MSHSKDHYSKRFHDIIEIFKNEAENYLSPDSSLRKWNSFARDLPDFDSVDKDPNRGSNQELELLKPAKRVRLIIEDNEPDDSDDDYNTDDDNISEDSQDSSRLGPKNTLQK